MIFGNSINLISKFQNKCGSFHIVFQERSQKFLLTILEFQSLPKLQILDSESQISQVKLSLYNGRRINREKKLRMLEEKIIVYCRKNMILSPRFCLMYRHSRNFNFFCIPYDSLYKSIITDECTVENELS